MSWLKRWRDVIGDAAIDEILFDTAKLGNSERIVRPPSVVDKSARWPIAGFAEIPEKPSEPPHLRPTVSEESGAGVLESLFARPVQERFSDAIGNQRGLRKAFLPARKEDRLLQIRISQPQLLLQNRDLRVLAAEAEDGGSGDVGMIDVSGEEAQRLLESSRVPPQTAFCASGILMPSTFGKSRERLRAAGCFHERVAARRSSWPER